jgi:hypothetical protein
LLAYPGRNSHDVKIVHFYFFKTTTGNNMKKITTAFFALLFILGYSAIASAHTVTGALGAGTTNEPAVDVYRANCFADPTEQSPGNGARMRVNYTGSGANIHRVSIVRQNPTTVGMTSGTTETTDGVNNSITRNGTNGDFYLYVSRTTNTNVTPSTYTLNYHCETAGGLHTGTTEDADLITPAHFIQDK